MTFRDRIAITAHPIRYLKSVDWVGRWENTKTVVSIITALVLGGGAWIMANWKVALTIVLAVFTVFMFFLPLLMMRWQEQGVWKRYEARKRSDIPKPLVELAKEAEQLAENLEQERRDTEGELVSLLNRNRMALRKIANTLRAQDLEHPNPLPPHRKTEKWETFLWNFIGRVGWGEADKLATLHQEVEAAFERREYWRDLNNIIRHLPRKEDK